MSRPVRDKSTSKTHGERGAALIVGLVLLVIMMVSGIAAMRGTALNEKATSNQRNKTISLMAAETGINQFYKWFASATSSTFPVTAAARNAWQTGQTYPIPTTATGALNANVGSGSFGYFWVDPASVAWDTAAETVSLTVTGHALSATTSGAVVSTSRIDVTMKRPGKGLIPSMPTAPLAVVGNVGTFNPANSNAHSVSSTSGPAIATTSAASTTTIINALDKRGNNYTGVNTDGTACSAPCVQTLSVGSPWGDAAALQSLISNLQSLGAAGGVQYYSGNTTLSFNAQSPPVTIVMGSASIQGNAGSYTGLLIVLGGAISITGGGGTQIDGGIYLANVNTSGSTWAFSGPVSWNVTGGGNMDITYNSNPGNIGGGNPFQNWKER